jgi:hypothetical protein
MITKKLLARDFKHRNHTILTGFRHKQREATLIPSVEKDKMRLVSKNVIIYIHKKKAALNYKTGKISLPNVEKNLFILND